MRVLAFGTFDNLHPGHLSYFSQAGKFGDELIVIIARDKNVLVVKRRRPQEDESIRRGKVAQALKELRIEGKAVLGNKQNRWLVLKKYHPEVICLGYDQKVDLSQLKGEIVKFRFCCKIERLKPFHPEKYKSSYCRGKE
ncbi:MAG: adenylyltransferase/cytidyltransferase family protein [Candidatus Falkowbacteria bacterium]|nr:adenylyltransferase/cytidyltransferase family protein [Candidatus Falkowbacteria bacterium]